MLKVLVARCRITLPVALIVLLSACAGGNRSSSETAAVDTGPSSDSVAIETRAAAPEPVPSVPEAVASKTATPDPVELLKRSSNEIAGLLGDPSFIRREPPAALWQYRTTACTLDLYFYDEESGGDALAYLEVRETDGSTTAREACFNSVIASPAS